MRGGWHDRAEEGGGDSDARGLHGRRHGGAGQEEAEPQLLRIVRKEESERQASVSFSCVILSKIYLFKGLLPTRGSLLLCAHRHVSNANITLKHK